VRWQFGYDPLFDFCRTCTFVADKYNLVVMLNPIFDEDGAISKQGKIRVDKNTFGKPGEITVWVEPSRFTWLDVIVDEGSKP